MRKASYLIAGCAVAAGALAYASLGPAQAAVTVIGTGPAVQCYMGADRGDDPGQYIVFCDEALHGFLITHDRAATYINRGVLRMALNQMAEAEADFNQGIQIDGELGDGYVDRAASKIEQRQFADAVSDINKGLSLGTRRPAIAYYNRAICDEEMGDVKAAYHDYQSALSEEPNFQPASIELRRFKVVHTPDRT